MWESKSNQFSQAVDIFVNLLHQTRHANELWLGLRELNGNSFLLFQLFRSFRFLFYSPVLITPLMRLLNFLLIFYIWSGFS
jgi:hypothetical protein